MTALLIVFLDVFVVPMSVVVSVLLDVFHFSIFPIFPIIL